jgi:signal transduction histidine kinase
MIADINTLATAIALCNIAFALLATIYISSAARYSFSIKKWRSAKVVSGGAFAINAASLSMHWGKLGVIVQVIHLLGFALELWAFCALLNKFEKYRTRAGNYVALMIAVQLLVGLSFSENVRLVIFSLMAGFIFGVLSSVALSVRQRNTITTTVAAAAGFCAFTFFIRALRGGMYLPLSQSEINNNISIFYYLLFSAFMINNVGFLLLLKQGDDDELTKAFADLERAERAQRELLSVASHEFRTPVAIIKASLDSLTLLKDQTPPEVSQRLDNIRLASQRMNRLADNLISYDRLRAQALRAEHKRIDVIEALRNIVSSYPRSPEIDLRAPTGSLYLYLDPVLLEVAMHNLIDNAIRYHNESMLPIRVSLELKKQDVEINVADAGPGIPDGEKQNIFYHFYSEDSDPNRGLGLAIVQSIARAHGGLAYARDNVPAGSVLTIRLPVND